MSHAELVEHAVRWLKNGAHYEHASGVDWKSRCPIVFAEMVTVCAETPDAIGFINGGNTSFVVECKASRADFLRDASKPFRSNPSLGLGDYRYYLAPKGMLAVEEMPTGWGLLSQDGKTTTVCSLAARQEKRQSGEVNMLWSAVRRLKTNDAGQRKYVR